MMACLEHVCHDCGWIGFSNKMVNECPECRGDVTSHFDEYPESEVDEGDVEPEGEDETL